MNVDFFAASMEARGEQSMTGNVDILIRVTQQIASRGGVIGILLSDALFNGATVARSASAEQSAQGVLVETFEGGGTTFLLNGAGFQPPSGVAFDVVVIHAAVHAAMKDSVREMMREPKVTWSVG